MARKLQTRLLSVLAVSIMCLFMVGTAGSETYKAPLPSVFDKLVVDSIKNHHTVYLTTNSISISTSNGSIEEPLQESPAPVKEFVEPVRSTEPTRPEQMSFNTEDIRLIALLMLCEAEGESEYGKRLVVDCVLNRVDSDRFPNTIEEVVYQRSGRYVQFEPMYTSRRFQVTVKDSDCELVRSEMIKRTNYDVTYFRTRKYHNNAYCEPLFIEGRHFFSKIRK